MEEDFKKKEKRRRGEGGRGRGEGGRGRGEDGRGRGEGGRGRGEGGRGRGEGERGRGEGGRGRGEGGRGRGEGERGRGEGGRGRGEGGRGRGEGGRGRGEGGRGRGEDGHGRGEGGRGKDDIPKADIVEQTSPQMHNIPDVNVSQKQQMSITPETSKSASQTSGPLKQSIPQTIANVSQEQRMSTTPETSKSASQTSSPLKQSIPQTIANVSQEQRMSTTPETSKSASQTSSPLKQSIPQTIANQLALSIPNRRQAGICGTLGRRITVEVNVMPLEFNKVKTVVCQYDVKMTADPITVKIPKFLMSIIFEAFRKKYFPNRYPAYDGRNIAYSGNNLPFGSFIEDEVTIFDEERQQERSFKVALTKVANLDLSFLKDVKPGFREILGTQAGMQALEVILRNGPLLSCVPVGRSLFVHQEGRAHCLPNGMELWVGSFSSSILGWKPYVNVDVIHKGFPKSQGVIELMREMCGCRPQQDITPEDVRYNKRKIESYLKKLKVRYEIPNVPSSKRTHEVNGLGDCPRNYRFERNDGTKCSIEEYFQVEKRYSIRYPLIPCLWLGSKNKAIYVPPELCTIIGGQVTNKKLDDRQTREMIKYAATATNVRKDKIMNSFKSLRMNCHPTMTHEFNLSVREEFEKVPARVLNPPKVEYNDNVVNVIKGVWHAGKFLNASILEDNTWTILSLCGSYLKSRDMYFLRDGLINGANSVGMSIGQPVVPFRALGLAVKDVINYFTEMKQKQLKLVIVIIPENNPEAYGIVKQVTELKVGVLTQCIKSVTVEKRMNAATIGNILLKINSKLNGTNHKIFTNMRPKCLSVPCMLVGADVTHPPPDAQGLPSIAAVTASFDGAAFKYNTQIRLQPPKKEIIEDLTEMMCKHLIFFRQMTNCKPQKIIFFRDGVSEGQIPQVMHHEISAMRNAFRKLSPDGSYSPPITFLIVQKRHHIRFFPTNKADSDDRNFNVKAGTIVDTHITHPSHIDFYLVSHASIQGTARPTKYKCICNECNMTEDEIEELTYYLCHMFSRCTRSVSYPAPTYYAHLAAFRARALIQNTAIHMDRLDDEQKKIAVMMKDSPMFYV